MITLIDALAVQAKYRANYIKEIDKEHALVDAAFIEKRGLPDNYWQARHAASRKLDTINTIVDVLREPVG